MMKKKEFRLSVVIVKEAIHRIDPYALLAGGSPDDEFDSEIKAVVAQLPRCGSGKDISHAIARVLTSSFGEKFEPSEFEAEGEKIYNELKESGIVF